MTWYFDILPATWNIEGGSQTQNFAHPGCTECNSSSVGSVLYQCILRWLSLLTSGEIRTTNHSDSSQTLLLLHKALSFLFQTLNSKYWHSKHDYFALNAACHALNVITSNISTIKIECSVKNTKCSLLNTECELLNTECSLLNTECELLNSDDVFWGLNVTSSNILHISLSLHNNSQLPCFQHKIGFRIFRNNTNWILHFLKL